MSAESRLPNRNNPAQERPALVADALILPGLVGTGSAVICKGCDKPKLIGAFYESPGRPAKKLPVCRECWRKARDWKALMSRPKKRRRRTPEQERSRREKRSRGYHHSDPYVMRILRAKYYEQQDPEKRREHKRRRRARKGETVERFTAEQARYVRTFWQNKCAACGRTEKIEGKALAIDHWLPLSRGYALTLDNAVLLCGRCNGKKGARLPKEVFSIQQIAKIENILRQQRRKFAPGIKLPGDEEAAPEKS